MKRRLSAILQVLFCKRFYLVTDDGIPGRLTRTFLNLTARECSAISKDAATLHNDAIDGQNAVNEAKKILDRL